MKFENTQVYGFEAALRGMRNPLESYARADSQFGYYNIDPACINDDGSMTMTYKQLLQLKPTYEIGEKDLDLAQRLIASGPEHAKFLRQICVWVDITAPLFLWSEFDTYKLGTTANSCSTMHKLGSKKFTLDMFEPCDNKLAMGILQRNIDDLNDIRSCWLKAKAKKDQKLIDEYLVAMKTNLPTSFLQKRTWSANYAVIRNMYDQRVKHPHRLVQWRESFGDWVESLPYAKELITI